MSQNTGGLKEEWSSVVEDALNRLIPVYRRMNTVMSFGRDSGWRKKGILSAFGASSKVLDAGCGPGDMTETYISQFQSRAKVVYLFDALPSMLSVAREKLGRERTAAVRGVFEHMPFRSESFDGIMMGFSFRDAIDMREALGELNRILRESGKLLIVDISKPDNRVIRKAISFYWRYLVPFIAIIVAGKYWRYYKVLYATYRRLPTNSELKSMVEEYFSKVEIHTEMLGGLIILIASK